MSRSGLRFLAVFVTTVGILGGESRAETEAPSYDETLDAVYSSTHTPEAYRTVLSYELAAREEFRQKKEQARTRAMIALHGTSYGVAAVRRMNVPPAARKKLEQATGGEIRRVDNVSARVPPAALPQTLELTVTHPPEDSKRDAAATTEARLPASLPVAFGPEGTRFSAPVTLTLPFDSNLVKALKVRVADLKVHYWDPVGARWEPLDSIVDVKAGTVSANVLHFSIYQVYGSGGSGTLAAIDDFSIRDAYAFPNPSRNGSAVDLRIQPGLADSIEVRVYDVSGRKVHASSDFRFLGPIDDGNGKGIQNTYDHVWDVSGVASGIYTYVITAKRTGQADIRKTGKIGVIK